jgi:hypothetical protein
VTRRNQAPHRREIQRRQHARDDRRRHFTAPLRAAHVVLQRPKAHFVGEPQQRLHDDHKVGEEQVRRPREAKPQREVDERRAVPQGLPIAAIGLGLPLHLLVTVRDAAVLAEGEWAQHGQRVGRPAKEWAGMEKCRVGERPPYHTKSNV